MLGRFEFVRSFVLVCLIILVNYDRYMHDAEIHLNANSVFILASKSSCVTYLARRSVLRTQSRSNASIDSIIISLVCFIRYRTLPYLPEMYLLSNCRGRREGCI